MPYTKSKARKTFDAEIDGLISVLRETRSSKYIPPSVKTHVLCSVVMLCTAKMEVFFEDFINDWITAINVNKSLSSKLPKNLRAFYLNSAHLLSIYKGVIIQNDENDFLSKLSKTFEAEFYKLAFDSYQIPELKPKLIYSGKKYPSPDNIKQLFNRIGISDILLEINKSAKKDMKSKLISLNDVRTSIAHEGIPVGINIKDIKSILFDAKSIIYHIDRVLNRHVILHTGINSWIT
jgi:hypothetical protein